MRKILLTSLFVLASCTSPAEPGPAAKPQLDGGSHTLPHAGPCHSGETEHQGAGGIVCQST